MGKFIEAKFNTVCKQTGVPIHVGDDIYYLPGRGAFHHTSPLYQAKMDEERKKNQPNEQH